jgi:uncharacterized protein involved in cysteine biosynthesis
MRAPARLAIEDDASYHGSRRKKGFNRVAQWLRGEEGQGMTEYVVVATLTMIPLIVLFLPMMAALRRYLHPIYYFIGLPIP